MYWGALTVMVVQDIPNVQPGGTSDLSRILNYLS